MVVQHAIDCIPDAYETVDTICIMNHDESMILEKVQKRDAASKKQVHLNQTASHTTILEKNYESYQMYQIHTHVRIAKD